jgi:hypothetical protein
VQQFVDSEAESSNIRLPTMAGIPGITRLGNVFSRRGSYRRKRLSLALGRVIGRVSLHSRGRRGDAAWCLAFGVWTGEPFLFCILPVRAVQPSPFKWSTPPFPSHTLNFR